MVRSALSLVRAKERRVFAASQSVSESDLKRVYDLVGRGELTSVGEIRSKEDDHLAAVVDLLVSAGNVTGVRWSGRRSGECMWQDLAISRPPKRLPVSDAIANPNPTRA